MATNMLGFEEVRSVRLEKIDEFFAQMTTDSGLNWTLVNPFALQQYSFEVPYYAQILLDIHKDSALEVYCMVILQNPLEESFVHLLAPILFNHHNHKAAQIVFSAKDYPQFAQLRPLKAFVK